MARTTSLFKYVLGNRFDELPASLRAMLSGTEPRWYRGTASVKRGSNLRSDLLGVVAGLPRKAHEVPFRMEVVPGVRRMTWVRHFAKRKLRTSMRPAGRAGRGRIVERVGAVTMTLQLTVEGGELIYRTLSSRLLGIPLPAFLAPTVEAMAAEQDGHLVIESTTRAGSIGRLLRYDLLLDPTPQTAEAMAAAEAVVRAHAQEPDRTVAPAAAEPARPASPAPPAPETAQADPEPTLMAQPSPAEPPAPEPEPTLMAQSTPADPPSSQRAPHPADPGDTTVPIDTAHARTGKHPNPEPRSEKDAPRPAGPDEATMPVSPSRRRRAPDVPDAE